MKNYKPYQGWAVKWFCTAALHSIFIWLNNIKENHKVMYFL